MMAHVYLPHVPYKGVRTKEVSGKFIGLGAEPAISTLDQFPALMKSELAKWSKG